MSLAKLGLIPFKIGEPNVKTDWIYVDNLVLALIMASMGLLDDIPGKNKERHPIAAGQPYFVSDGNNAALTLSLFNLVAFISHLVNWFANTDKFKSVKSLDTYFCTKTSFLDIMSNIII